MCIACSLCSFVPCLSTVVKIQVKLDFFKTYIWLLRKTKLVKGNVCLIVSPVSFNNAELCLTDRRFIALICMLLLHAVRQWLWNFIWPFSKCGNLATPVQDCWVWHWDLFADRRVKGRVLVLSTATGTYFIPYLHFMEMDTGLSISTNDHDITN